MKRIDAEDVALLASIIVAGTAVVADEIVSSTLFKVLKILALILSLGLAINRIRTSKPFVLDFLEVDWVAVGQEYEVKVARKVHGRGRFPVARCLTIDGSGHYAENFLGASISEEGDVRVREPNPARFRLEIRKS